ncbi:heterokaryon incompatibility protein-domain-containing protein [Annulohypoxylon maeteangense]|uniref:heterokaryon incompatibility protein-domain-containing protein n=1 Tax=Annulohypoxylon maeteangense TaxID=1927788 RepID=UPI00200808DF|nr:heterokaryon incompatibility protein-domain-containing protein [Annulohypoxylon maeteangense]KAI0887183.1 heterokaryon incompatibility protein-domain-containing protein [Annulohypoxylon maeteangense]
MDYTQGVLCDTCISVLKTDKKQAKHHQSYDNLVTSKNLGCMICTWIWSRNPRRQIGETSAESFGERFTIAFSRTGLNLVTFQIESSLVASYQISVCLRSQRSLNAPSSDSKGQGNSIAQRPIATQPLPKLSYYMEPYKLCATVGRWISTCQESHDSCKVHRDPEDAARNVRNALDALKVTLNAYKDTLNTPTEMLFSFGRFLEGCRSGKFETAEFIDTFKSCKATLDAFKTDLGTPQATLDASQATFNAFETILNADYYFPSRILYLTRKHSGHEDWVILRDGIDARCGFGYALKGLPFNKTRYDEYWTLSHRWGDPGRIKKLCKETENELRSGIPLSRLSPTFRDAAILVRNQGYRYLWIDSLCIYQDSHSDWQREAGSMANIYRHSFCNISAISPSFDPSLDRGLFHDRMDDVKSLYPFIIKMDLGPSWENGPWVAWNASIWADEIESAPLHTRGWVVQERFLTNRIIHFTRNQIYWECLQCANCETNIMSGLFDANALNPVAHPGVGLR